MPRRDALKGARGTGYHFQEAPAGPCSPHRGGHACVCAGGHAGGAVVGGGGINYLCDSPAEGDTKVGPRYGDNN